MGCPRGRSIAACKIGAGFRVDGWQLKYAKGPESEGLVAIVSCDLAQL